MKILNPKLILVLALVLSGGFCQIAQADYGAMYDSVEWQTCLANHIGIFHAGRIYGPHSVTNSHGGWAVNCYTADFKLIKAIRGNPPGTFSRNLETRDTNGFRAEDDYVFFFTGSEFPPVSDFSQDRSFHRWNYVWLDRPLNGKLQGMAIDHKGRILTGKPIIMELVEASLKLPRANPSIEQSSYISSLTRNSAMFNFRIISFPTPYTYTSFKNDQEFGHEFMRKLAMLGQNSLVIPESLFADYLSATNKLAN